MTDDRDQVAITEPDDDQDEEIEVAEDEAEQVKGGPLNSNFIVGFG